MKLIFKYLKPFIFMALAAIALLFCQTILELYLPNYMSKIVNVGIVQSGVEVSTPDVIDEASFDQVLAFASEGGARVLSEGYVWKKAGKADEVLLKRYPALKSKGSIRMTKLMKTNLQPQASSDSLETVIDCAIGQIAACRIGEDHSLSLPS